MLPFFSSALYVVDLKKFRKIAAGDRLRGQYQALSQDPNSLSNLDQVCDWHHTLTIREDFNVIWMFSMGFDANRTFPTTWSIK